MLKNCKYFLFIVVLFFLILPTRALSEVDPNCTDGECTEYVEDCWNRGREVVCLNPNSDHAVTLCLPLAAVGNLIQHYPDVCRGASCGGAAIWGMCYSFGEPVAPPPYTE